MTDVTIDVTIAETTDEMTTTDTISEMTEDLETTAGWTTAMITGQVGHDRHPESRRSRKLSSLALPLHLRWQRPSLSITESQVTNL